MIIQKFPFRNPKITLIKTNKGAIAKLKGTNSIKNLSQTDALFLSLCDGTKTIDDIAFILADVYKIDLDKTIKDITKLIENSIKKNFITVLPVKNRKRFDYFEDWHDFIFIPENSPVIIPNTLNSICFSLTNYCPYNCSYCFGNFNSTDKANYIPKEIVLEVIKEAISMGGLETVLLTGGDPIAYPDLGEIITFLETNFISYELSTKGLLLTENKIRELARTGLKNIQISVDSWNSKKWSEMVGLNEEYFSSVIEAFACCYNYHINTRARITLTKNNAQDILELIENLYTIGVEDYRIVCLIPTGRGDMNEMPSETQIMELRKELNNFKKKIKKNIKIIFGMHTYNDKVSCGGGKFSLHVCSDGKVLLCDVVEGINKEKFTLGNIYDDSLKEVWNSEKLNQFRYRNDLKECQECDRFSECNGGCYAFSFAFTNSFSSPDPRCSKLYGKNMELFTPQNKLQKI